MDNMSDAGKHAFDLLSIGVVIGTLSQLLPAVAALFTIIWTAIRIWETKTVGRIIGREDP